MDWFLYDNDLRHERVKRNFMQQRYGKEASGFERMEKTATHELTRTFRNFTYMQTKFVDPLGSVK